MFLPNLCLASEDSNCISTYVNQIPALPARTQNVSQHMLTKSLVCQRGLKIYLYVCCPYPSHASDAIKCISKCVDRTTPMPARTQNVSENVLTKPSHASEDRKGISTCFDLTNRMPARTQNVSQQVLTKTHPCQRGHKMHLNMC